MSSDWHICRGQAATSIAITESRWLERPPLDGTSADAHLLSPKPA